MSNHPLCAGRAQSSSPDLLVSVVVKGSRGNFKREDLHLPVQTAYKNLGTRWAWNQWLELPIMFCDLPRLSDLSAATSIYMG